MKERSAHKLGRRDIILCFALAVIVLVPYLQVLGHDFVLYDDTRYVTENPHVQEGLTWDNLKWAFTATEEGFWHPLTWLTLFIDYELYGLNPGGYHATNLVLHIMNTLLLFLVLTRMTGAVSRSALVAALFAVHPLHVESVAWVAERKDVLSALFFMLTLGAYVLYAERPTRRRYLSVIAPFLFGLMAKPMLVTIPIILIVLDYWPLRRLTKRENAAPLVWEKVPLLVTAVLVGMVTIFAERKIGALPTFDVFPLGVRFANAIVAYSGYLGKTVWPFDLAVFYPYEAIIPWAKVVLVAAFLLVLSFMALRLAGTRPYLIAGWSWYVVTLLPVIGIIQVGIHSMADRYTYIPLIGIFITAVWGIGDLLKDVRYQRVGVLLSTGILAILSLLAWFQTGTWKNSEELFKNATMATSGNFVAHNNLGLHYLGAGKLDEAVLHFSEAVRFSEIFNFGPEGVKFLLNLGTALSRQKKYKEASSCFLQATRRAPDLADAHFKLADAYFFSGNDEEAVVHYKKTLDLKPDNASAENNWAMILMRRGMYDEAVPLLEAAIRHNPRLAVAQNNLGVAFARQGNLDRAVLQFQESLKIDPQYADARRNLAQMVKELKREGRPGTP